MDFDPDLFSQPLFFALVFANICRQSLVSAFDVDDVFSLAWHTLNASVPVCCDYRSLLGGSCKSLLACCKTKSIFLSMGSIDFRGHPGPMVIYFSLMHPCKLNFVSNLVVVLFPFIALSNGLGPSRSHPHTPTSCKNIHLRSHRIRLLSIK